MLEMFDISRLADLSRDRQREILEAVKVEHLRRQAEAERPGLRDRLLLAGGGALIALGQRLEAYACRKLIVPCEAAYPAPSALPRS